MKIKPLCLIAMCVAVLTAASCRKTNTGATLSIPELSSQLQSSQAFNRYMLFTSRLKRGMVADKYNLTAATSKQLKEIVYANVTTQKKGTMADLAQSMNAIGIENAKEFVFLNVNIQRYRNLLLHEFPQLKSMPTKDAVALMHQVYFDLEGHQTQEPSLKDLIATRKLTQQNRAPSSPPGKIHVLGFDESCYNDCTSNCFVTYMADIQKANEDSDAALFDCQTQYDKDYNAAETEEQENDASFALGICQTDADTAWATAIIAAGDADSGCVLGCTAHCTTPN